MKRIWLHSAVLHIFRQRDSWRHECTAAPLTSQMILITANTEATQPASYYQHAKHTKVQRTHTADINVCYSVKTPIFLFLFLFLFLLSCWLTRPSAPQCGEEAAVVLHQATPHPQPPLGRHDRASSRASSLPESEPNSPACHAEPAKAAPDEPPHWHVV